MILQNLKRISAACLAVLFLMLPASAFLIHKDQAPSSHAYFPIITEEKFSFQELNNILGAEHLYNKLSDENNVSLLVHYGWTDDKTYNNLIDTEIWIENSGLNDVDHSTLNFSPNAVLEHLPAPSPVSVEIRQRYQNEERFDFVNLSIFFGKTDNDRIHTPDVSTVINGITVHLAFPESSIPHAQASFVYQDNLYVLNIISQREAPDIDRYLEILLEGEKP